MTHLSRRRVLSATAATGVVALAGCTGSGDDDDDDNGDDAIDEDGGVRLLEYDIDEDNEIVTATVENASGEEQEYVGVGFSMYDEDGELLTARFIDGQSNVEDGETVELEVLLSDDDLAEKDDYEIEILTEDPF